MNRRWFIMEKAWLEEGSYKLQDCRAIFQRVLKKLPTWSVRMSKIYLDNTICRSLATSYTLPQT